MTTKIILWIPEASGVPDRIHRLERLRPAWERWKRPRMAGLKRPRLTGRCENLPHFADPRSWRWPANRERKGLPTPVRAAHAARTRRLTGGEKRSRVLPGLPAAAARASVHAWARAWKGAAP